MNFRKTIVLLMAVGCVGCVIPVPHPRIHAYGVRAQIVDAVNGAAITNATVATLNTVYKQTAQADAQGRFVIRPVYGWHAVYLIGPVSLSLLPGWDMTVPVRGIHVMAPGYQPQDFVVSSSVWPSSTNQPTFVPIRATIRAGYLETEYLQLVPAPKSETHP